jgi:S-DNA-T family DNA segregation ATPase FtsK/SpoIIIE
VDIITGPIKANLTSRVAFRTIQSVDSRTILGYIGSEKLLGNGDMLFLRNGASDIERFHGAFISEEDVEIITNEIKKQNVEIDKLESFEETGQETLEGEGSGGNGGSDDRDELFAEAARMVVTIGQGSTSLLQRRMKIGFARAGRLMDELEAAGIVGPQEGSKPREILITTEEVNNILKK